MGKIPNLGWSRDQNLLQYSFYGELVQFQLSRAISPEQLQLRKFEIVN